MLYANIARREKTVEALYQRLLRYRLIQVRGTPASGKTTLCRLLAEHIRQKEPNVQVIYMDSYSEATIAAHSGWENFLKGPCSWVESAKTVLILDEAQSTYSLPGLWNFLESIQLYSACFAIAVIGYGSSTTAELGGAPILIPEKQNVTLYPMETRDGLPLVGLHLNKEEFDDLISKSYPASLYRFDPSFLDALFSITSGNVGAIKAIAYMIQAHDVIYFRIDGGDVLTMCQSYSQIRHTPGQPYTWDFFLKSFGRHELAKRFSKSCSISARGLPQDRDLQDPAVARVFDTVLRSNVVMDTDFTTMDDRDALQHCFRHGWLFADRIVDANSTEKVGYVLPSMLHRWFLESKLRYIEPAPLKAPNLLEFVLEVIRKFSPNSFSAYESLVPGFVQQPPKTQYRLEFHRCSDIVSEGSVVAMLELRGVEDRVNFYVPSKNWGVEILCDGEQPAQCGDQFWKDESNNTTLELSDYIALDFRCTEPTQAHPLLPKLCHVVFTNNWLFVHILDNMLQPVHGGELMLLPL